MHSAMCTTCSKSFIAKGLPCPLYAPAPSLLSRPFGSHPAYGAPGLNSSAWDVRVWTRCNTCIDNLQFGSFDETYAFDHEFAAKHGEGRSPISPIENKRSSSPRRIDDAVHRAW